MSNTMQHSFARMLSGLVSFSLPIGRRRPNKRLKLPGGDRSKGSGVLCPGGHELTFNITAPCGRVARSFKRDPLGLTRSPGGRHRRLMMRRLASSIAILLLCATTAGAQDVLALRSATVIDGTSA